MSLTFTDIFCGAGGSSTGLTAAGMELKLAANHWPTAIETHAANHPDAEHVCADINNYDMRRLPTTDVLWASPICTEISPAGGRRRARGQLALDVQGYGTVASEAWERTRATAYDVLRATEVHRYQAVMCENVVEFATDWELFDWWRAGMHLMDYTSQVVSVSSAHVGDDPAPQWRDRIYIVFVRNGVPPPDLAPRPTAWCHSCGTDVQAVQSWRNGRRIGKYRQQYDYRCPNRSCRHALVEPYVRPAASIIDWSNLGIRIGDRPAHGRPPLVATTLARIQAGLDLLAARPDSTGVLIPTGGTWNTTPTVTGDPMRTRLANPKGYEALLTPPRGLVVPYRKGRAKTTDEPILTLATRDSAGLVASTAPAVQDCHYRMVQPREQLAAQRFPTDYVVHGNQGEQTMQAGNAVSCNVAQWVGERVLAAFN